MEDKRFYHHWGVDPKGMLRALWVDIRLGYKAQGASTITQQLARTLFLTNKKSLMRKTKEMVIATALEKKYTKDEILNMYLNEIYMGRGVCGMEAAAQAYFNKSVDDLSVGETAYLVAMIASPEYYSPDHDFKALKKRQLTVLKVMQDAGIITKEEEETAARQPVYLAYKDGKERKLYSGQGRAVHFAPDVGRTLKHPYFTVYVLQKLKNEYGEDAVYRGGLKVYTTMDSRMQTTAEKAIEEKPWSQIRGITARDAALVSVEPGTGAIRALVGGVDFSQNQINMAAVPRQPGSAIKPLYYAAAINEGLIDDSTVVNNTPRYFGKYRPLNDHSIGNKITVRQALVYSQNVASVEILNLLGVKKAAHYLERFGISTLVPGDLNLALGLGGMTKGISPIELAAAYAALADQGIWAEPYSIERIEDADGTVLYEHSLTSRQVVSSQTARLVTSMLRDVVSYGTGTPARIYIPSAGKTGTTSKRRDLWFVGYTSRLATAVWVGNSDQKPAGQYVSNAYGGRACGPVFRNYYNSLIDQGILTIAPEDDYTPYEPPTTTEETTPSTEQQPTTGPETTTSPSEENGTGLNNEGTAGQPEQTTPGGSSPSPYQPPDNTGAEGAANANSPVVQQPVSSSANKAVSP